MATEDTKVIDQLVIPEGLGIVSLPVSNTNVCCGCGTALANAYYQVPTYYVNDGIETESELYFCVHHMRKHLPAIEKKLRDRLKRQEDELQLIATAPVSANSGTNGWNSMLGEQFNA